MDERRVIDVADEKGPRSTARFLHLSMAAQAEVRIANSQHLCVHRAMRSVADGAAFAECRMFEDVRFGLFAVTVGTGFIDARHRETAGGFHDIKPVRIVALNAGHFAFKDGMMLRQMELGVRRNVTLETSVRLFPRVDNEFGSADGDVFAARTVAGFAALLTGYLRVGQTQARVGTGGKGAGNFFVALSAPFVSHVGGTFNLRRSDDRASAEVCAGVQKHNRPRCHYQQEHGNDYALHRKWALWVW